MVKNLLTASHEYDEGDWMVNNWFWRAATNLTRVNSMDVANDPRFFAGNVMDKRLSAFKSLTLVSSIMFGTALGQCFSLKKDFDLSQVHPYVGNVAAVQLISFFLALLVAVQCLLSLYIIAQQLFYTYRLMTAGSLGFDIAAVFYLTRTITWWRHLAIKFLFNGLLKFLVFVGLQLFVKFFKDADAKMAKKATGMIVNMRGGTAIATSLIHVDKPQHKLNMGVHIALGYLVFFICTCVSFVMYRIRSQHMKVFEENYLHCEKLTHPIEKTVQDMGHRSTGFLET